MTTSAWRTAASAAGVRWAADPGPSPTTATDPGGPARRATATVVRGAGVLATTSRAPGPAATRAAASATDGVPTARSTTALGVGTVTGASTSGAKAVTATP